MYNYNIKKNNTIYLLFFLKNVQFF